MWLAGVPSSERHSDAPKTLKTFRCSSSTVPIMSNVSMNTVPSPCSRFDEDKKQIFSYHYIKDHAGAFGRVVLVAAFSRMRSEGFPFNSGGLGVEPCSRPVVSTSATVLNRPRPTAPSAAGLAWKRDVSDSCEIARKRVETSDVEVWRMSSLRRRSVL